MKKLFLLLFAVILTSCSNGNFYDNVIELPSQRVETTIREVSPRYGYEISMDFENVYKKPIDRLYVTYCVTDDFGRILRDYKTGEKMQHVIFLDRIEPDESTNLVMPNLFYNRHSYKADILRISAKFRE